MTSHSSKIDTFFQAAALGQFEAVKELINDGLDINTICPYEGDTVLTYAASEGHVEMVKWLLDHGADPDHLNDAKESPLHYAVFNNDLPVVELLLAHDCKIDYTTEAPLVWATRRGLFEAAEMLVNHGANLNVVGEYKETPLMYAAKNGKEDFVALFLRSGVDLDKKNSMNETAEDLAAGGRHSKIISQIKAYRETMRTHELNAQREHLRRYLRGPRS